MDYYYYFTTPLALLLAWTLVQGFNLLLVALTRNRSRKFPPGPFPLPIIGNLHLLGNQPHKSLAKLADFHGPIMRLKLGQITTVVISSSDMAKQLTFDGACSSAYMDLKSRMNEVEIMGLINAFDRCNLCFTGTSSGADPEHISKALP
ncbi:hypothetical protein H5410_009232 [Solanum commersonii]|uniref:Uncharacterized protein n=1 Tax=Solanum commersonii TaxID=4109 RepID=A0A9J6AHA3_SOLCO|nr:hypothetical protein H5410_009232 [Solanum commersonii]